MTEEKGAVPPNRDPTADDGDASVDADDQTRVGTPSMLRAAAVTGVHSTASVINPITSGTGRQTTFGPPTSQTHTGGIPGRVIGETLPGGTHTSDVTVQEVGRYLIKGSIGRGGMASVFRAHDPAIGRDVAIKFLHASFCADEEYRARAFFRKRVPRAGCRTRIS